MSALIQLYILQIAHFCLLFTDWCRGFSVRLRAHLFGVAAVLLNFFIDMRVLHITHAGLQLVEDLFEIPLRILEDVCAAVWVQVIIP